MQEAIPRGSAGSRQAEAGQAQDQLVGISQPATENYVRTGFALDRLGVGRQRPEGSKGLAGLALRNCLARLAWSKGPSAACGLVSDVLKWVPCRAVAVVLVVASITPTPAAPCGVAVLLKLFFYRAKARPSFIDFAMHQWHS